MKLIFIDMASFKMYLLFLGFLDYFDLNYLDYFRNIFVVGQSW